MANIAFWLLAFICNWSMSVQVLESNDNTVWRYKVMGSVYCPETDVTYTSLDEWLSSEQGASFKTAEITGTVAYSNGNIRDDTFTAGCLIKAAAGQELDHSNINGSHAEITNAIRFVVNATGAIWKIEGVAIYGLDLSNATSSDNPVWVENCFVDGAATSSDGALFSDASTTGSIKNSIIDGTGASTSFDGFYSSSGSENVLFKAINCLVINAGRYGNVRCDAINTLVLDSNNSDYLQCTSLTNCASSDSTAVGTNCLTGRTTSDLVNYATGDWRTALSSPLATGGDGISAGYIGAALESQPVSSEITSSSTLSALNSAIQASQTIEIVDISSSVPLSGTAGLLINSNVELVGISSSIDQLATGNLSSTINIEVNDISSSGLISLPTSIMASVDVEEINISSSVSLQSSGGLYIEQAVNNDIQSNSSIYGNASVNASIDIELKNIEISSQLQSVGFLQSSIDIELNNIDSVISLIADSSETEFNVVIQQIRDSITINKIATAILSVNPSTVEIKLASGIITLNQ